MFLFDFNDLFVFEMANNHQGDVEHGLRIISEMGKLKSRHGIKAAIKFQFRKLDTFIHPDFKNKPDLKHIPRFLETQLSDSEFQRLVYETVKCGLIPMGTAFDEESVDQMLGMGVQIVKIASCSAADQPLIKKIATTHRPVIASLGGMGTNQIDRLVNFFELRKIHFALMHCVAIYPTPNEKLRLDQIELLRHRYPGVTIGFSTHEEPTKTTPIQLAYAKGARIFEKHVGLETDKYKLNAYSASPAQVDEWLKAYKEAVEMCGGETERPPAYPEETSSLNTLKRGVWTKTAIQKGEKISEENIFFAMPLQEAQLKSDRWSGEAFVADRDYAAMAPLSDELAPVDKESDQDLIYRIVLQVRGMLRQAGIAIGGESSIEISHHYGLHRFREFGAVIVDVVNRSYCKKLIIQLPRQKHPYHYHQKKEETFQLLSGDLELFIEGKAHKLALGDTFLIKPNEWHKFQTLGGAIFEEISTRHYDDDSIYEDEKISRLKREERKTKIANWEAAFVGKL